MGWISCARQKTSSLKNYASGAITHNGGCLLSFAVEVCRKLVDKYKS